MSRACVWIAVAAGVGACSDGRPLAPDAEIWGCGDGVVAPEEECDDGPGTGTSTSLCTLDCRTARVKWVQLEGNTQLPFPARKMVGGLPVLVISNFDDRGIAIVPVGNKGPPVILKKYAAPVSFEVHGVDRVVWIERAVPGLGGPWLLWTIIGEDPPVIREIPYPVEGAEAGTFALRSVVGPNGFVWRIWTTSCSTPPYRRSIRSRSTIALWVRHRADRCRSLAGGATSSWPTSSSARTR
jgi:hypothetical protein